MSEEQEEAIEPEVTTPEDSSGEENQEEDGQEKWKNKIQRRFDMLTARNHEKDSEIATLKAQVQTMMMMGQAQQQAAPNGPPNPDNFETTEAYVDALTDYKMDQKLSQFQEKSKADERKQTEAQRKATIEQNFSQAVQTASGRYKDYLEVVNNPDVFVSNALLENVKESDMAGDLLYYIGKNPSEAQRLSGLNGSAVAREVGKLEAKLAAPQQKKITKAPDPIPANRGASTNTPGTSDLSTASPEDIYNRLNKGLYSTGV